MVFQPKVRTNVIKNEYSDLVSVLNKTMMNKMCIKNKAEVLGCQLCQLCCSFGTQEARTA
jgi:hypothetical protein